jgi:hypothetical protein
MVGDLADRHWRCDADDPAEVATALGYAVSMKTLAEEAGEALRYEQKIMTWCTSGPSGAASPPLPPGPSWRVVGLAMASDGRSTFATIVYEHAFVLKPVAR